MKKYLKNIRFLGALLLAGSQALSSCSVDDMIVEGQPTESTDTSFTLIVNASKGGEASTRALSLDGKTLNATWTEGDEVTVFNVTKDTELGGSLVAQSSGSTTQLWGELTGTIENGDKLTLKFLSPNYSEQDGTLTGSANSIDKVCDYAEASVEVSGVTSSVITTTDASFENRQAIVKFSLVDEADGTSSLNATQLTVTADGATYTVTPASASSVLYVAVPSITGKSVALAASVGFYRYVYERPSATFAEGKYYEVGVKMTRQAVDLSKLTADFEAQDGDVLINTLVENVKITIADGATVTLSNAVINGADNWQYEWAGITCNGDATIILDGENTVKGFYSNYPCIFVPEEKTLTIQGDGSLDVPSGSSGAAAIGAGYYDGCGNIVIAGGTITATGGYNAAAIGGVYNRSCGNITISGGTITATGGEYGVAIGSSGSSSGSNSTCGDITISGGTIIAEGKSNAAAIGCGSYGTCGDIEITGGTVTATPGYGSSAIGCGVQGHCGNITIASSVNKVTANKNFYATNTIGTGNGASSTCGTITIGGIVRSSVTADPYIYEAATIDLSTLTASYRANDGNTLTGTLAEIVKVSVADGAYVTLNDVVINPDASLNQNISNAWAGLTCEGDATIILQGTNTLKSFNISYAGLCIPAGKTLTITGDGSLTASCNASSSTGAAGIGGNLDGNGCGNIVIAGGTINATSSTNSAAIGGTGSGDCGDITITGGTVIASCNQFGPGIGGGVYKSCGNITITDGVTSVTATTAKGPCSIGKAAEGKCGTVTVGGVVYADGVTTKSFVYAPSH